MKKIFLAFCFIMLLSFSVYAEENRAYFPPVLMYHDIKIKPLNKFDVTVEDFCAQLDFLKENEYITLSIEDFISYLEEKKVFPEKSILITFDDGYNGIYNYAVPELKKRNMKATCFITTETVGKIDGAYPHITEQELKEISSSENFSIGSHTLTHSHLDKLNNEEKINEIKNSKEILEKITCKKIQALAYPYGDYDEEVIEAVKKSGYKIAFAVQDRGLFNNPARWSIPRISMGMALSENNLKLFKDFIKNYKNMPQEAFIERWEMLKN